MPTVTFELKRKTDLRKIVENLDHYMSLLFGDFSKEVSGITTDSPAVLYRKESLECWCGFVKTRKRLEAIQYVDKQFPRFSISFSIAYDVGVVKAKDEDEVARVVSNVFGNAISFINRVEDDLARLPVLSSEKEYQAWMVLRDSGVTVNIPIPVRLWLRITYDNSVTYSIESRYSIDPLIPLLESIPKH
jgi:hypothetical protein